MCSLSGAAQDTNLEKYNQKKTIDRSTDSTRDKADEQMGQEGKIQQRGIRKT